MQLPNHPRISVDPGICFGKPVITDTRMPVHDVIALLAAGLSDIEIHRDYPYVAVDDVRACLTYASDMLNHPVVLAAE